MKKRYWIALVLLFLVGLDWYIRAPDSHSRELTRAIETQGSEALKAYPYQFRVLKVVGDTAYLSTPRNTEVPAFKALGVLFPDQWSHATDERQARSGGMGSVTAGQIELALAHSPAAAMNRLSICC